MFRRLGPYRYLIPRSFLRGMTVEGLVFADDELIKAIERDLTMQQIANVATLPGLVGRSLAMRRTNGSAWRNLSGMTRSAPAIRAA